MRPLRVFLCHASQDKPAVRKLHRYLKQRGVQPWLDELDLLPGENWEVEIPNAIFSSDVILVCLSKNSVDKEGYVQKEISFALDKALEKPEGTIFIVPVKLEDCDVPKRLNRFQWVDVFRQDGYKRLMLGLQKRASGLGEDVSTVILDDTRRAAASRTPKPEIKKPEEKIVPIPVKEESKKEIPALETSEVSETSEVLLQPKIQGRYPEVKFTQKKPFTKLLDPASLSHPPVGRVSNPTKPVAPKERQAKSLTYGFWGIGLLVLILGGFGVNYLIKNQPIVTVTVSPTDTATHKPLTLTPTKTPISTPTLGIGSTMIGEKGETLVYVPEGEFTMGNGDSNAPIHTVYLDSFWIDQTEVTNKQYQACVDAGTCEPPSSFNSSTHPSYYGNPEFDNFPVLYVSWDKANRYCEVWAGGDLPTEAQWEKAARGTDERVYPWGNDFDCSKGNFDDETQMDSYVVPGGENCDGFPDTAPVGSFPDGRSPYEVYDMAGSVWEWVNDYYQSDYYAVLGDSASNPVGPESGEYRVLRGGSWDYNDSGVRSAYRDGNDPSFTSNLYGFRCVRLLP
jgi:formylglycine-generating enzyme required for sulfatase activity